MTEFISESERRGYEQAYRRLKEDAVKEVSVSHKRHGYRFDIIGQTLFWGHLSLVCWVIVLIFVLCGYPLW